MTSNNRSPAPGPASDIDGDPDYTRSSANVAVIGGSDQTRPVHVHSEASMVPVDMVGRPDGAVIANRMNSSGGSSNSWTRQRTSENASYVPDVSRDKRREKQKKQLEISQASRAGAPSSRQQSMPFHPRPTTTWPVSTVLEPTMAQYVQIAPGIARDGLTHPSRVLPIPIPCPRPNISFGSSVPKKAVPPIRPLVYTQPTPSAGAFPSLTKAVSFDGRTKSQIQSLYALKDGRFCHTCKRTFSRLDYCQKHEHDDAGNMCLRRPDGTSWFLCPHCPLALREPSRYWDHARRLHPEIGGMKLDEKRA